MPAVALPVPSVAAPKFDVVDGVVSPVALAVPAPPLQLFDVAFPPRDAAFVVVVALLADAAAPVVAYVVVLAVASPSAFSSSHAELFSVDKSSRSGPLFHKLSSGFLGQVLLCLLIEAGQFSDVLASQKQFPESFHNQCDGLQIHYFHEIGVSFLYIFHAVPTIKQKPIGKMNLRVQPAAYLGSLKLRGSAFRCIIAPAACRHGKCCC